MSSSFFSRQGLAATLFAIGLALLFSLSLGSATADAAPTFKGNAHIVLGAGKTGAFLTKSGVKVNRVGAAKVNRKGKRFVVKLPVRKLVSAKRSDVSLNGGFVLRKGKHAVRVRAFNVAVLKSGKIGIGGSIQKIKPRKSKAISVNIFNVAGKAKVNKQGRKTTLRIKNGKVRFTNAVVKRVRNQLRLNRVPRGHIANLNLNAVRTDPKPELVDPYLAQCNVDAESELTGSITPAGPLPEFTNLEGATGPTSLAWGFKESFRNYVATFAGGSIHALDGAATTGAAPKFAGFEFPAEGFRYTDNGTPSDLTDDKAVVEGSGTALFCATGHGFRAALSNPTLVIDGANSRIDADVDANLSGTWIHSQRVTVATVDPSRVSRINEGTGSIQRWTAAPVRLTVEGSQAICGVGELDRCSTIYPAGTNLDPVTLEVALTQPVSGVVDQYQDDCGVPVAGISLNAWEDASEPPTLVDPVTAGSSAGLSWGFLQSFRNYVLFSPPAGSLQPLDGASREPGGDPVRGFTFPVTDAEYAANEAGDPADDQAVIDASGTGLFCKPGHGFWASISNPTVVIDGANSRIVADISQNTYGPQANAPWQPAQRVDLANLDLSGVTPTYGTNTVTWSNVPVTLSEEASPFATYTSLDPEDGPKALDPITITLETE